MAKLILTSSQERNEFELSAFNSIGRHPSNSIQILDRILSKEHAHIMRQADGTFLLKDLGSLNGTYVGGERVSEKVLVDGDLISLGQSQLSFVYRPTLATAMQKVTIGPGGIESFIQQRLDVLTGSQFLPEKNIRDEAVLRRDYEKLRIGQELLRAIGSELDLSRLIVIILDKSLELFGADRGAILLMENGELVPQYVKTRSGRDDNIVVSKTVAAEVVANRAAVLSSDASLDTRFSGAQSIIMQGVRSTMTIPILYREEILGILHLDSLYATNAFTEKDLHLCTGVAAQAAVAIENARLVKRIEREAQTRAQISRLIPPSVVEQVLRGELVIEKGGRLSEITMLYSDIRGFTSMSDGKAPEEVVNALNEYFEVMVEVLFRHAGTLDKFVGDEIIGLFGAPIPLDDAPYRAICCAVDMLSSLHEFNQTRQAEGQPPISIGIGINTGRVITGAIGSTRALQYTAIGDAMNVASRMVSLAKVNEIIISETTYRQVQARILAVGLPPVSVKGKAEMLKTYRVTGLTPTEVS